MSFKFSTSAKNAVFVACGLFFCCIGLIGMPESSRLATSVKAAADYKPFDLTLTRISSLSKDEGLLYFSATAVSGKVISPLYKQVRIYLEATDNGANPDEVKRVEKQIQNCLPSLLHMDTLASAKVRPMPLYKIKLYGKSYMGQDKVEEIFANFVGRCAYSSLGAKDTVF